MWIKRRTFETLVRENAALNAQVESLQDVTARLDSEITYWRERFEAALNRADRVVDAHFGTAGLPPVSDVGIAETKASAAEMQKKAQETMDELAETLRDDDGIPAVNEDGSLKIDPSVFAAFGKR